MKLIINVSFVVAALFVCVSVSPPCKAAPKPTISTGQNTTLPEIWQKIPAAQRLQFVRAAELDATRVLAERIMGTMLDNETSVRDLASADDSVKGSISAFLRGVKTTGKPTYHDDGRVEVVRSVKIGVLIQDLKTRLGPKGNTTSSAVSHRKETETIDALGNAAIPGSLGHQRVLSKRAAEMDVYRRLAERTVGIHITSDSTVKDFATQDDKIRSEFSSCLKGAIFTSINYGDDGITTVSAKMNIGPLVRVITKTTAASGKIVKTDVRTEQLEIEETGTGSFREEEGTASGTIKPSSIDVDVIISSVLE